jgi:hypothetical protein
MLMLIEEQNAKGGLLGKKLEPVMVDPASKMNGVVVSPLPEEGELWDGCV